jgi:hypothetical protein
MIYNLGSVADRVLGRIPNIPTTISGTELWNIIDNQRVYMEEKTGLNIGSTAIIERFQPALIALSCGAVARALSFVVASGLNTTTTTSLGEFSVARSNDSSISSDEALSIAGRYEVEGERLLKFIGNKTSYYKANG